MMNRWLSIAAVMAGVSLARGADGTDPIEVWEQTIKAKGGHERLRGVHSLAIFMRPAQVNFAGTATNWLCVFPDRYFEFDGAGVGGTQRALVVDANHDRAAADATGIPRSSRHLSLQERERLILNQIVFLLETAWLAPRPEEVRHNALTVVASGHTYKVFLDKAGLPERILSQADRGEKHGTRYDYRLQHYRDYDGIQMPARVTQVDGVRESVWDVDYEFEAKFNPKLFERMPDLANGPEPWRMR